MNESTTFPNVAGVVLAGGKSSRMGQDKAFLKRDEQTMLQFTAQQLRLAGVNDVIVSGSKQLYSGFDKVVEDTHVELGPLGGMYSVLCQYPEISYLLFIPVDLPLLSQNGIRPLLLETKHRPDSVMFSGQPLPLMLANTPQCRSILEKILKLNERLSIRHFISKLSVTELQPDNDDYWFNANTPQEWQQAIQRLNANVNKDDS